MIKIYIFSKYIRLKDLRGIFLQRLLKLLITSEKRCKIILELSDVSKSLAELSKTLDITPSNLLPYLRKLEYEELVKSKNGKYSLTESGKLVKELFLGFMLGADIVEKYMDFWNNHDISPIPNNLLKRIYELESCEVVKNPLEGIYELHEGFIRNIEVSDNIYGISSIYHPDYPLTFLKLAKTGKNIYLILTENVFNKVKEKNPKELNEYLELGNAKMYVVKDAKLAMVVSDRFLYLSLYFKNGVYDVSEFLISYDKNALMWGRELFGYYLNKSKEIDKI